MNEIREIQIPESGWQTDLETALFSCKRRIILYGNIFDYFIVKQGNRFVSMPLKDWLGEKLEKCSFEIIIQYDLIDGLKIIKGSEQLNTITSQQITPGLTISDFDESQAYDPTEKKITEILKKIRMLLKIDDCKVACICLHSDKIALHHQSPILTERIQTLRVAKLSSGTRENVIAEPRNSESSKHNIGNTVILIYDQEGLIPTDLYQNDSSSKMIHIPLPDFETRRTFFLLYQSKFHSPQIDDANINSFARLSDGFSLLELLQVASLSKNREINLSIKNFSDLLSIYRSGAKTDEWKRIGLPDPTGGHDSLPDQFKDIRGQDEALYKVIDMLHRARAGISRFEESKNIKPRGVLFFVGPTGVGKTMLAKKIAEVIFGSEEACTMFDMSEFQQEHQIARLIGAPPGYVGHETGGELTNKIRERPLSVLLFDEIEKAHNRILDIFLQILDSGRLTDGKGQIVSFSDTIIIFSSNIGTNPKQKKFPRFITKIRNEMKAPAPDKQFDFDNFDIEKMYAFPKSIINTYFNKAVEFYFCEVLNRPELFNRIGKDNIIVFNFLDKAECEQIANRVIDKYLNNIQHKWQELFGATARLIIQDSTKLKNTIIQKSTANEDYRKYGARDLENKIIANLETPLAKLFNQWGAQNQLHDITIEKVQIQSGKDILELICKCNTTGKTRSFY